MVQMPGPGTLKQRARSPTPTDGNALAATLVTVKRSPMTWEPEVGACRLTERTSEKGGAGWPDLSC